MGCAVRSIALGSPDAWLLAQIAANRERCRQRREFVTLLDTATEKPLAVRDAAGEERSSH
jgi:hypothetical protein